MNEKTRYYIEICDKLNNKDYIIQSKWYDTREDAINFCKTIDYIDNDFDIYLMSGVWNIDEDYYEDITSEELINLREIK